MIRKHRVGATWAFCALTLTSTECIAQVVRDTVPRRRDPYAADTTRRDTTKTADATKEAASTGLGVYAENDLVYPTDQNYTGGFGISAGGAWVAQSGITGLLTRINQLFQVRRLYTNSEISRHTFAIVGAAYTPVRDSLGVVAPIRNDRPYASLFGMQMRRTNVGLWWDDSPMKRDWAVTSELTIAALGWNLAKALQTDLHRTLRRGEPGKTTPVDPLGWHNQISNGGEPTLLYRVGLERILFGPAAILIPHTTHQLTWQSTIMGGYYNNVSTGVSGRWGRLASNYWEFTTNPTSSQNQRAGAADSPWELYVFAGARGRLQIYNALLRGQFRDSPHKMPADQVIPVIGEGEAGAATTLPVFGGNLGITAILFAGRTPEFSGPMKRAHYWGAAHVSWAPRTQLKP